MIQGILFDMDGVLVDSEEFICEAAIKMFAEHGLKVNAEDFIPFVGTGENRYIGGVAEKYGFDIDIERDKTRTYEIYDQITKGKLEPLPGVVEFIEKCRERNLKLAVATSADKPKMLINLREIGLPANTFDAVINGLDVERKKPYPDIYLKAASEIGVEAKNSLVVEDAITGIEAGKRAGAKCLGIITSFSTDELSDADWTAQDLSKVPDEAIEW